MKTAIIKGLTGDAAKEVEESFLASVRLREQLIKIVEGKMASDRRSGRSRDAMASPSWAYEQAYDVGRESAFSEIISLLSNKSVEKQ